MKATARFRFILLLVFITAFCSYAYELVLANILSVLWGNVVQQYTITTGLYIAAMGTGAYLSPTRIHAKKSFIWIEILLAALAIVSPLVFVYGDVHFNAISPVVSYALIAAIGFFSGMELPLLLRILEEEKTTSVEREEKALFADYAGMFLAGILFALFLNRQFGSLQVNLYLALANIALALVCGFLWGYQEKSFRKLEVPAVTTIFIIIAWSVLLNSSIYEEQIARWIIVN
jgi:spermidine synthase